MATTLISNAALTNADRGRDSSRRRKRKKKNSLSAVVARDQAQNPRQNAANSDITTTAAIPWKSEVQQQVYSSKLLQALRQVRPSSSSSPSAPKRGRAVREAADRVLAATAKGRTRWSRAILTNRLKISKFMKKKGKRQRVAVAGGTHRPTKKPKVSVLRLKTKNLPAVQRKGRVLGRLVPGCRKQPLPVVLEEATDYIAALEMQVRAMAALAELLSGSSSNAGSISSRPALNY